jgi:hypothetical protein
MKTPASAARIVSPAAQAAPEKTRSPRLRGGLAGAFSGAEVVTVTVLLALLGTHCRTPACGEPVTRPAAHRQTMLQ